MASYHTIIGFGYRFFLVRMQWLLLLLLSFDSSCDGGLKIVTERYK